MRGVKSVPADGTSRLPVDSEDPASDLARVDEYLELLGRLDDRDNNTRAAEFDSRTAMYGDVVRHSGIQTDDRQGD